MKKESLDLVVRELLERSGSLVDIKLESHFPGNRIAGGKYSMGTHTVTLYMEEIKNQCLQLFSSAERFLDYFTVVFAHELGHAEDQELEELANYLDTCLTEQERCLTALKIEENAWAFAEKLLPDMDKVFMQKIIYHSLKPYREQLQMEPA
ncbi:hypothetical protein AF332_03805 [Sporosarcina globispora]|uniref:IrrE N-terminal-like domain-containing protein n=1 Tax=Sporosarcina globispora TaxID=1459 RepID=A0A0M0G864_SPOGL|nr:hypothetical protein [Sporosarcina globispora]KON86024.1 hypothetical protein AF332_03805 [Sporosarcina globispora]